MKLRDLRFALLAGAVAAIALSGCGKSEKESTSASDLAPTPETDFSPVIARVGDVDITQGYFDYRYDHLTPTEKARYTGDGWEGRFLKKLIDETLICEQAKKDGFLNEREVQWRLDMANRSILYKTYYDYNFKDHLDVPDDRIAEYYEQHPEEFQSLARATASHIQCRTKKRIDEAKAALDSGQPFGKVVGQFSEDEATKANDGSLGWFNPGGFVIGMGFNKEFTKFVFDKGKQGTYGPVKIGDTWHIIRISGIEPGGKRSLEEAHDSIESKLRPGYARQALKDKLRELNRAEGVEVLGDYDIQETRTAEQLYRLAGESHDPRARVEYYESLVENYPDHELADDALFMAGFLLSEKFGDVGGSGDDFQRLLQEYPDSPWVESARWLLGHGRSGELSLREKGLPADAQEAGKRVDSARQ